MITDDNPANENDTNIKYDPANNDSNNFDPMPDTPNNNRTDNESITRIDNEDTNMDPYQEWKPITAINIIQDYNHKPQKRNHNPYRGTQRMIPETATNSQSNNTQYK